MAFIDDYATGVDDTFKKRVLVALCNVAISIIGEAQGTMSVNRLTKRHNFAVAVKDRPGDFLNSVPFIAAAAGLSSASTDAQLVTAITNSWNKLAGVMATD